MNEKELDRLYKYSLNYFRIQNFSTAVFWANKLNTLDEDNVEYLIFYAFLLLSNKQYHRAIRILENNSVNNIHSNYLTAKAYFEIKQAEIALEVLESITDFTFVKGSLINDFLPDESFPGCIFHLKGKIHEANGNSAMAVICYKQSLEFDPMNYDAFESLSQLTSLVSEIDKMKFNPEDPLHELTRRLYHSSHSLVSFSDLPGDFAKMENNLDVLTSKAKNFFYLSQFYNCYQLTKKILDKNPFNPLCLPIHISVLKVLEKQNELFILSDELVNSYPDKAVSWYASGCYYFSIGSSDLAKAHFKKSLQLNRHFAYSWIALGHVSSSDGERDQAISAYCEAANTIVDSHMAVLYMGMEYSLTETTRVAIQCFKEAEALSKSKNPFVFGEIGVCFYKSGNYEYACIYIMDAIKILESDFIVDSSGLPAKFWEPFYNNLGHALRKTKMYQDSLKCHRKALKMVGDSVVALEGLAMTLMMMNRLPDALACFSRAVDLRKPISMNSPTSLGIMLIVRIMNKLESIEKGITTQIVSGKENEKSTLQQEFLEDSEYLES